MTFNFQPPRFDAAKSTWVIAAYDRDNGKRRYWTMPTFGVILNERGHRISPHGPLGKQIVTLVNDASELRRGVKASA